jgi:RNA polymerase sigma-70 factor (ECF subfamily)
VTTFATGAFLMVERRPLEGRNDDELALTVRQHVGGREAERATNILLDRWQERVYRWTRRFVRNREDALELTQEILVQMVRGLRNYEPRGQFGAWLFTIARYRCLSAVRAKSLDIDPDFELESILSPSAGPDAEAELREREAQVLAAMKGVLDPREQLALWLRAYEDMSVEDITRVLGLGEASGARGLLQTARRKLRAALEEPEGRA